MNKIKQLIKKNKTYLLTFFLSVIVVLLIAINTKVFPFGSNTLAWSDLLVQIEPFFKELIHKISTSDYLFYSFNNGLGSSFYMTLLYYLISPINILIYIFKNHDINKILNMIILVKPVLASLTMSYYLKKKFNSDKIYPVIFALLYAFSGFYCAYYMNIMWLNAYILLPIITLGIERLLDDNKKTLLILSLFFAIVTNFYQGYMLTGYTIIYAFFYMFYNSKLKKEYVFSFIKTISISLLLSSFIILPAAFFAKGEGISSTLKNIYHSSGNYTFSIMDFITSMFNGTISTRFSSVVRGVKDLATNTPNISVGVLGVALLISFISNKKIDSNNKRFYLTMLLVLASCFCIPYLGVIMEAFHIPNDMPFRYSYMFSFILLVASMYSLENIDKKSIIRGVILTLSILVLILIVNPVNTNRYITLINIIVLLSYLLFNMFYSAKTKYLSYLVVLIVLFECVLNFTANARTTNLNEIKTNNVVKNGIASIRMRDDSSFYRIGTDDKSDNLGSTYNINSLNMFNSVSNFDVAYLQKQLGLGGNGKYYYYYDDGATPVYNTLFDIKYLIGEKDEYFDEIVYKVNKFQYNKDLMFEVDKDILNWDYKNENPFNVQNDLVKRISKEENIFTKVGYKSLTKLDEKYYEFEVDTDSKYIYIYLDNIDIVSFGNKVYYQDTKLNNNKNPKNIVKKLDIEYTEEEDFELSKIIKLNVENDKKIRIHFTNNKNEIKFYKMDNDKFMNFVNSIETGFSLIGSNSDEILGTINVTKDNSIIFTSLEANSGWKIYDGDKEIKQEKIGNALLAFELDKGLHTIYLKYEQPYYKEGMIITCATIILLTSRLIADLLNKEEEDEDISIS